MTTHSKQGKNEIEAFLTSLFFMEIVGRIAVSMVIWLFRFFGMPQLYNMYYSHAQSPKWVFCIILLATATMSIIRICRLRQGNNEKNPDDNV